MAKEVKGPLVRGVALKGPGKTWKSPAVKSMPKQSKGGK